MLALNDSIIVNDELWGCLIVEYVYGDSKSTPVRLTITWMDFRPRYPKYKEAGVVTGAVLFGEIKQNISCTSLSTFFSEFTGNSKKNERDYRKKTQERKHKRWKR